jgi:hypothetical protein
VENRDKQARADERKRVAAALRQYFDEGPGPIAPCSATWASNTETRGRGLARTKQCDCGARLQDRHRREEAIGHAKAKDARRLELTCEGGRGHHRRDPGRGEAGQEPARWSRQARRVQGRQARGGELTPNEAQRLPGRLRQVAGRSPQSPSEAGRFVNGSSIGTRGCRIESSSARRLGLAM